MGFNFLFFILIFIYFLSMKLLSVEMACLLGVQNEIQAVWIGMFGKIISYIGMLYVCFDLNRKLEPYP